MKSFTEFLNEASKSLKKEFQKVFDAYNAKVKKTRNVEVYYIPVYNEEYGVFLNRQSSPLLELGMTYQLDSIINYKTKEPIVKNATKMANGLVLCLENEEGLKFITKALAELDKTGDYTKFVNDYREIGKRILANR
jgi:hypothetical protein